MPITSFPEESQAAFSAIISEYPGEKRYIIPIMHHLNKYYHYLPRPALELTAQHTGVPFSQVYSMATFYKTFSLVPRGCHHFKVCDGTTCHIKGSRLITDELQKHLGIKIGETSSDRQFSMETVNCIGACAIAPALLADDKVYPRVTPASVRKIIQEYGGCLHDHS